MGYLTQASATVADATKLTISMVVELPESPAGVAKLFSWGNIDAVNDPIRPDQGGDGFNSYIGVRGGTLEVRIRSPINTIHFQHGSIDPDRGDFFIGYESGGGTTAWNDVDPGPSAVYVVDGYGSVSIVFSAPFSDFVPGARFHVFVALDVSEGADLLTQPAPSPSSDEPYSYRFTGKCSINGTDRLVEPTLIGDGGTEIPPFGPPIINVFPTGFSTGDGTLPIWPIAINGQQISLPGQDLVDGAAVNANGAVRCGNVLMWAGQYIDPAVHIGKFFSGGAPVNPSEAIAAFGTPDFDIRGPASSVETNRGTGGDFVKTGTASDSTW